MTVEEVEELLHKGYNPYDYYYGNPHLKQCLDWLGSDYFMPNEPGALHAIHHSLFEKGDPFLVLADFDAYINKQKEVELLYQNRSEWARKAILNTSRMGYFSSDRTIHEYAKDIWDLESIAIPSSQDAQVK